MQQRAARERLELFGPCSGQPARVTCHMRRNSADPSGMCELYSLHTQIGSGRVRSVGNGVKNHGGNGRRGCKKRARGRARSKQDREGGGEWRDEYPMEGCLHAGNAHGSYLKTGLDLRSNNLASSRFLLPTHAVNMQDRRPLSPLAGTWLFRGPGARRVLVNWECYSMWHRMQGRCHQQDSYQIPKKTRPSRLTPPPDSNRARQTPPASVPREISHSTGLCST